jgi:hypothetical protein
MGQRNSGVISQIAGMRRFQKKLLRWPSYFADPITVVAQFLW